MQRRFDEAVKLAEQAFADELEQLVGHLAVRLSGEDDGSPKVFRDSAVANLMKFFDRFQRLNIRSDDQLDRLVADARNIVTGVSAQELHELPGTRRQISIITHDRRHSERVAGRSFLSRGSRRRRNQPTPARCPPMTKPPNSLAGPGIGNGCCATG